MNKALRHVRRVTIAVVGSIVVLVGIIAIPYPGPGWLIVFAGLAILATEFESAQRVLDKLRYEYDKWTDWLKAQTLPVKLVVLLATGLVVVATVWLLNGFGLITGWLHIDWPWLKSPLLS